jgi:hypothetical protein
LQRLLQQRLLQLASVAASVCCSSVCCSSVCCSYCCALTTPAHAAASVAAPPVWWQRSICTFVIVKLGSICAFVLVNLEHLLAQVLWLFKRRALVSIHIEV